MNQPETQASLRRKRQKLHPRVVQYAKLLGVEPERFLRFLKHPAEIPGLLEHFRALRHFETGRIPLKELISQSAGKKARQSGAKTEAIK
jgi:hypothetical protein